MKTNHPTTIRAIVVTCIWTASLGLRMIDLGPFEMFQSAVIVYGFVILCLTPDTYRRPLTWMDGVRGVTIVVSFILICIVFIKFPELQFATDEPYHSIVLSGMYLFLAIYLWHQWHKARQKDKET